MPVHCSYTADETYAISLSYPEIRLMNQGATGQWTSAANPASNATVEDFSATCYFTALHLKQNVPAFANVPIGLVRSSVGGQVIERFMSIQALEAVGVPTLNATNVSCGQSSHTLYDSIIAPLAPFVFKTMLWCASRARAWSLRTRLLVIAVRGTRRVGAPGRGTRLAPHSSLRALALS